MEKGLTKNQVIAELSKSPHGKLQEYVAIGKQATIDDPAFMAHLIAWDRHKGQVRDAKVALPIVSLHAGLPKGELADNSLAHLAMLGPRELLRAYRFALELKLPGQMRELRRLIETYLHKVENSRKNRDHIFVQHRRVLKELYALLHVKPSEWAEHLLFKNDYTDGSVFEAIAKLKHMSPVEAAAAIHDFRIPFLIASGALGAKAKEPDLVLALINRMSATELVTNTKLLERLGIKSNPALRGAYEQALERAQKSSKNVLKTTRAAEVVDDEELSEKLRGLQEKQLASQGVEGNWLVLGDKSGSMASCIETARQVAAVLAKMVKGKVWLTFFDTSPQTVEVTGAALDHIQKATQYITADGGTSIGCGLQRLLDGNTEIDGIAVVSDGEENTAPYFAQVYDRYVQKFSKEVPVYFYKVAGAQTGGYFATKYVSSKTAFETMMATAKHDLQVFDLSSSPDYYSLPNLVTTMRTNRYSLIDEIMATPLLVLEKVLPDFRRKEVATNVA